MKKKFCFLCVLFSAFIFFASAKESRGWDGVVNKIIDGNTLTIKHGNSYKTVRLYGIDAPDLAQSFGDEAKKFLEKFILGKTVTVTPKKSSMKNSAEVFILSGYLVSVNKKMIKKGFAWSTAKEYTASENKAKKNSWDFGVKVTLPHQKNTDRKLLSNKERKNNRRSSRQTRLLKKKS